MAIQQLEQVTITAGRVNDHGIQALDGTWYNISKFAGQVDVRRIESLSESAGANNTVKLVPVSPEMASDTSHPAPIGTKYLQICRMNALAHAVAIVTYNAPDGQHVKLADVLSCASQIEVWITRSV